MASFVVTTLADAVDAGDGVLSLREALVLANGNGATPDTITFAAGLAAARCS
jgi:CSLREA domain-containing protein